MNQVRSYGVENSKLGTVRGIRITPDDEVDLVELKRDTNGRIPAALREAIGCDYIDCVGLPEFDMWIDDEGILTGAERNTLASILT